MTAERWVDLHVHTWESDGSLSPSACVDEAARLGLAALAVTDHDTVAGNAEAAARGAERGIEAVPGVELSATLGHWGIHILGYWPDPETEGLRSVLARLAEGRRERNPQILDRLSQFGLPVAAEEVAAEAGGEVIGRPHIAAVMLRRGYVGSFQEAFSRYLSRGARAYVPRWKPTAAEAIAALRAARAVPVLAHPGAMGASKADEVAAVVVQLVRVGLCGLEVLYPTHDPGQVAAYTRIARQHGLVATGGTDFHGASKPEIQMGSGTGRMSVPARFLEDLRDARERL
jgi:3',5'-nucleoside bisphosphate phosphatase